MNNTIGVDMKVVELLKDLFFFSEDVKIVESSIKKTFEHHRNLYNDDKRFFNAVIHYLGGRGYNEFLDYSLFATKLNVIFEKHWYDIPENIMDKYERIEEHPCSEAVTGLLFDDRHDLYQNLPYQLDDIEKGQENKEEFWKKVTNALIECINVNGTEDVSCAWKINEIVKGSI